MAAETVDLGYVKGPTGDTGPVGPTGPQGDPATVPTVNLESFQGYIGYNEVESSTATGNECVTLSQLKDYVETVVNAALQNLTSVVQWQQNASNVTVNVPNTVSDGTPSVVSQSVKLFGQDGTTGGALQALANVSGNLMLAVPEGEQGQVLGYLGDNTYGAVNEPRVQTSAALTAAYEAGGSGGASGLRLVKEGSIPYLYNGEEPVPVLGLKASTGYPLAVLSGEVIQAVVNENSGGVSITGAGQLTRFSGTGSSITHYFDSSGNPMIDTNGVDDTAITADDLTNIKKAGTVLYLENPYG